MSVNISTTSQGNVLLTNNSTLCPTGKESRFQDIERTEVVVGDKVNITFQWTVPSNEPFLLYASVQSPKPNDGYYSFACGGQKQTLAGESFIWDVKTFSEVNDLAETAPNFVEGASLVWVAVQNASERPPIWQQTAYYSNNFTLVSQRSAATLTRPLGVGAWIAGGLAVLACLQAW